MNEVAVVARWIGMRRRFAWLGAAAIALGFAVLLYRGPGRAIVRGHIGDVAATMLVYAVIGTAWRTRRAVRAGVTLAVAVAIELVQIGWHARSTAGELLVGSTFDPWDLVAYVVGVAVAVGWDVGLSPAAVRTTGAAREPGALRSSASARPSRI